MNQVSEQIILESLSQIIDPDLRKDIVKLGLFATSRSMAETFRSASCLQHQPVRKGTDGIAAHELVSAIDGVTSVKVTMDAEVPQGRGVANNVAIPGVKNIIAVSSARAESANRPSR